MRMNLETLWVVLLLFGFFTYFGAEPKNQPGNIFSDAEIILDKYGQTPLEIRFNEGKQISVTSFFQEYKSLYQLSEENTFRPFKIFTDNLGQTHYRCRQYYKGVELAEVQYLLHEKEGAIFYAHGQLIHHLDLDVTPDISESLALQFALEHINAEAYMWENKKTKDYREMGLNDKSATFYPNGELKISAGTKERITENFRLVYRFDIFTREPLGRYDVDVDAKTGEVISVLPRLYYEDVAGLGISKYNGEVPITVSRIDYKPFHGGWHLTNWNGFFGEGESWWMADPDLGNEGGYENMVYQVLDTDPVTLTGTDLNLSFFHRLSVADGDGCNVRISRDGGATWEVLLNPSIPYPEILNCFRIFGERTGVPGWNSRWYSLDEWTSVMFDLSSYAGETVRFRFAFASNLDSCTTDGYPDCFGWQLDEIMVTNSTYTLFRNDGNSSEMSTSIIQGEDTPAADSYRLRESGRGKGIITLDAGNQYHPALSIDFLDDDSIFTNAQAGVSVHWGSEVIYDYFLEKHGRNSYDDEGERIVSYVNYYSPTMLYPAFYMSKKMYFATDDSMNESPHVHLYIVGHEFTHGVIEESADLNSQNESGALNESFADIFGVVAQFYVDGSIDDRIAQAKPDTYLGEHWYVGEDEVVGIHTNSGVQNKWFYLLWKGGTGINDHGFPFSLESIGLEEAEQIAYRNLTVYLMPNSYYYDARLGSMNAAIDLFGQDSPQYQAVIDAWNAVGVLPVITTLFELSEDNGEVTILWHTVSESDSNFWIIERKEINTENNKDFERIVEIESRGERYVGADYEYIDETVVDDQRYAYRLVYVSNSGEFTYLEAKEIYVGRPEKFALYQNYPNPFNSITRIEFDLPRPSEVTLKIYNILGEEVTTLLSEILKEGKHTYQWPSKSGIASGVYLYRLQAGEYIQTRKMVLIQ